MPKTTEPADSRPASSPTGRRKTPRALRVLLQLAVTAIVTWFILDRVGVDLARLAEVDVGGWTYRWGRIVLSVILLASGYALSAVLWGRMVAELGGPRIPPLRAARLFLVANLGRYVPGKVLQLAGLTVLAAREGVRPATAAVAAVLGQGVALLGATLVGLAAFFSPGSGVRVWGWLGLGAVALFLAVGTLPPARRLLATVWRRFARDPEAALPPALEGPGFVWRWTLLYALNWGIYATAFWFLFIGLAGDATFLQTGPAFAAAYVGGYLVLLAPAGVGVRESLLTLFLASIVTPERALALAVIARLWTTAVEIVPALALTPGTLRGFEGPARPMGGGGGSRGSGSFGAGEGDG